MSVSSLAGAFSRDPFYFVEVQIGASVYRFCQKRTQLPAWMDGIPCLANIPTITPAEADIAGGSGLRASISCVFEDFADSAVFGTINTPVNFWPTWRARHPYYEGGRLSFFSGYLRLDSNGVAVSSPSIPYGDFNRRDYVIERFKWGKGSASMTGKDPLKLANNNRAQIPAVSRGALKDPLTAAGLFATLAPVGVGTEYPTSGFVRVRAEVMAFTRAGDVLTLTRAQYNTVPDDHGAGDTVQICAALSGTVDALVKTILQAAGVSMALISPTAWAAEVAEYLPGLYSTLITEPTGCQTLLKELAEQAPHFLYWDDKANRIQFVAVKAPPPDPLELTAESNFIKKSFDVEDAPDMRVSRVFVYFGQFDPTKKLDDVSNYRQAFIRVDPTSESSYGSARVKTVFSRWISNVNKAAAVRLASRIGRRFSSVPKKISFALDPKDQQVWIGSPVSVVHPDIVNSGGDTVATHFQLTSAGEKQSRYEFKGLESLWGPAVPEDEDIEDMGKTVIISGEQYGLNLRDIYNTLFPALDPDDVVKFIFDSAAVIGGTTPGAYSVRTGAWAGLSTPITLDVRGRILGRGGRGGNGTTNPAGRELGSPAILLEAPIQLDNSGIIAAGGDGGLRDNKSQLGVTVAAGGGGGAGWPVGPAGGNTFTDFPQGADVIILPQNGSQLLGGGGGTVDPADPWTGGTAVSGPGQDAGAGPAHAITTNGHAITYINAGDIRGPVV